MTPNCGARRRGIRTEIALLLVAAACSSACAGSEASSEEHDAGSDASEAGSGVPFLTLLATPADLIALSSPTVGPEQVKYLAPIQARPRSEPFTEACYFQNMSWYTWHLQFLRSFPRYATAQYPEYLALVLRPASRRLWGGEVRAFRDAMHPESAQRGVLAYTLYSDANTLEVAHVIEVDRILKSCIPFGKNQLVFAAVGADQEGLVAREHEQLRAEGAASLLASELAGDAGSL
jgi:hypothetical protein